MNDDDFDARLREAHRTGSDRIGDPAPQIEIDPNVRCPHFGLGARPPGARVVGARGIAPEAHHNTEAAFRSWATDQRDDARGRR